MKGAGGNVPTTLYVKDALLLSTIFNEMQMSLKRLNAFEVVFPNAFSLFPFLCLISL